MDYFQNYNKELDCFMKYSKSATPFILTAQIADSHHLS